MSTENLLRRHSGAGRNPAIQYFPRSGQNRNDVPLCGELFNYLDSGLRRNDGLFFKLRRFLALPLSLCILLLTGCATPATHPALQANNHLPELIPVREFVANRGSNWGYQISPDGKKLAWLAIKGVSISIFIKDLEHNSTRTFQAGNFYGFDWAQDSRHLFFMRSQGDENAAYASFDTEQLGDSMQAVSLSPGGGVKAVLLRQIADDPAHVWIVHNQRDSSLFDLYKVNLATQESVLAVQNPGNATNVLIDAKGVFRGRVTKQDDISSIELLQADALTYKTVYQWSSSDLVDIVSIADGGATLYLLSNKGRDRRVLLALTTASGEEKLVYEDPVVDVSSVYTHPLTGKPLIAFTDPDYPKAELLDPALRDAFKFLSQPTPARINILSSDRAFQHLTFCLNTDKGTECFLYDMARKHLEKIGSSPSLEHKDELSDMKPIELRSRDGIALRGYLTLPKNIPAQHLPMVLWVHGGPWGRDVWGYNTEAQLFANRGYAVMQINYRGSLGYGRRFEELAVGEFAGKMQDDLLDGVNWAIEQGIADPNKIAIAGGSYGGYATLVGMSFTPEKFACGIDLFGPSDLTKLVADFPPYWKFEMDRWHRFVGDPGKAADREIMHNKSPLFKADNIHKPLLVIQGGMDVRVRADQSEALVEELRRAHKPVEYWFIPDAGHGFNRWPQRLKYFRKSEDFLAECLGGRSSNFDFYQLGAWMF
ncbi:MAG: S9 family peptidase [Sideroxydans sp.]|nr:S9 family peptidase [Sideroxydans sp.]